jgi:hypothetical protein
MWQAPVLLSTQSRRRHHAVLKLLLLMSSSDESHLTCHCHATQHVCDSRQSRAGSACHQHSRKLRLTAEDHSHAYAACTAAVRTC